MALRFRTSRGARKLTSWREIHRLPLPGVPSHALVILPVEIPVESGGRASSFAKATEDTSYEGQAALGMTEVGDVEGGGLSKICTLIPSFSMPTSKVLQSLSISDAESTVLAIIAEGAMLRVAQKSPAF